MNCSPIFYSFGPGGRRSCRRAPTFGCLEPAHREAGSRFAVVVLISDTSLLLVFLRGIALIRCEPVLYVGFGVIMQGIGRRLLWLPAGSVLTLVLILGPAHAAAPEWNAVRTHSVRIGAEAGRLVVGFRATAGNTVAKAIRRRNRAQSVLIVQARTSDADAAGLARRTGLAMAGSRQITPSTHVLY